jgi:hypothetical protein
MLLLARADVPALVQANKSVLDDGQRYRTVLNTNRVAPAGAGGECIFTNLYFSVRHYVAPVLLLVTVALDGNYLPSQQVVLENGADTGTIRELEISLMQALLVGGIERSRYAPRGGWIEVFLETADTVDPALLDIGTVEVEYEIVRETRALATAPA